MLVAVLSVLATVLTTLRSWPQFVRIVRHGPGAGVSATTWMVGVANHTGWLVYGALADVPLLVPVNAIAAAGCAATVGALRSATVALAVTAGSVVLVGAVAAVDDRLLAGAITVAALVMFLPQLVRTVRRPGAGVSAVAWAVAASASATWLAYAWAIGRPAIALAHLVMLPASLVILARVARSGGSDRPGGQPPRWRTAITSATRKARSERSGRGASTPSSTSTAMRSTGTSSRWAAASASTVSSGWSERSGSMGPPHDG